MKLLRVLILLPFVAVIAFVLAGCGGNGLFGSAPVNAPGGGGGGALTDDLRLAALDAVNGKFQSLQGLDTQSINQQMLKYLQSRPEFEAAGVSRYDTIWARFTDGVSLIVFNNRAPANRFLVG